MSTCCVRPSFADSASERERIRRIIMGAAERLTEKVLDGNANTPIPGLFQAFTGDVGPGIHEFLSNRPLAPMGSVEAIE